MGGTFQALQINGLESEFLESNPVFTTYWICELELEHLTPQTLTYETETTELTSRELYTTQATKSNL